MTDKRIKLDCPFCHTKAEEIQIKIWNQKTKDGTIYCPNCGCAFHGEGRQNLIDKWNRR
jgi:transcription elongation factor Elf1